jgi:hypothetical protein
MSIKKVKTKMVEIPAQELKIHPVAQRDLVRSKVADIKANLDLDAIGDIYAVQYPIDGVPGVYVIDGQTRVMALIESGLGEWPVRTNIFTDVVDDARACQLFLRLNNKSTVRIFDKFRNAIVAGYTMEVAINTIIEHYGLRVTAGGGGVSCIQALISAYKLDNGASLSTSLGVILKAWGKANTDGFEGPIILGLAQLLAGNKIDISILTKKLAKRQAGPSKLIGDARAFSRIRQLPVSKCMTELLTDCYNSRKSINRVTAAA